jgi:hypothetical protein
MIDFSLADATNHRHWPELAEWTPASPRPGKRQTDSTAPGGGDFVQFLLNVFYESSVRRLEGSREFRPTEAEP